MDKIIRDSIFRGIDKFLLIGMVLTVCSAVAIGQERMPTNEKESIVYNGIKVIQDATTSPVLSKIISIHVKAVPLLEAVKEIAGKSNLEMVYNSKLLERKNRPITLNLKQVTVKKALWSALEGTGLRFAVSAGKQLVLMERKKANNPYQERLVSVQETITGTVTDAQSGETLPGVNILVKGTSTGASTDADGQYELTVESLQDTLVFSYIGYKIKKIPIKGRKMINVKLKSTILSSDNQLVVVGYGTQKEISLTGAISSLPVQKLEQSPTSNISQALAGRLPGLIAVQSSGLPGQDQAQLQIRGYGTFNQSGQNPLILVDGIERTYRQTFDNIDPHTIKSITILKDASATAIYGVRGANGVILVTTKSGHNGPPSINASYQRGVQTPTRLPDYANSYESLKLYRQGLVNDGKAIGQYTDQYLNKFKKSSHRKDPVYKYLYPNVDWLHTMLRKYAPESRGNINVSGGSNSATYFISASYFSQQGIYNFNNSIKKYNIQASDNKYNFRAKTNVDFSQYLSMHVNLSGIFLRRNYPSSQNTSTLFSRIKATPSWYYPLKNPNGSISGLKNRPENPYSLLTQHGYTRHFDTNVRGTAGFQLDMPWITKGLSTKVNFTFTNLSYRTIGRTTSPDIFHYNANDTTTNLSDGIYNQLSSGSNTLSYDVSANERRRTQLDMYLNYQKDINNNSINGMLYFNQRTYNADIGSGSPIAGLPHKMQGLVGRARYGYRNKYYTEFNFGYNGSENFKKGHRYGFFPSLSFAWVASNESFVKKNLPFLDLLKFRFSVGEVGNDQIGEIDSFI